MRPTSDTCVQEGETFTCAATSGYPGFPSYAFYYWTKRANLPPSYGSQIYEPTELGNFSLICEVKYSHQHCPQQSVSCYANHTGTVTYGEHV